MQVKRQQLEPDMEQWSGSKLGKEYVTALYCHPACLTSMQSTAREMLDWMNHKLESRFPGRNTNNLRYVDETTLMEESEEELKSFLMRVQGEGEKAGFKLNIQKMKIMATSPITSWQIEEEKVRTLTDFIFLGSKITADGDCSHEIKRRLFLARKAMTNLRSVLKSKYITLLTKVYLVKAMVFPIVIYEYEN